MSKHFLEFDLQETFGKNIEFIRCKDFTSCFRILIEDYKQKHPTFTLKELSFFIGASSKTYISDIVSGRRILPLEKLDRLSDFFGLSGTHTEILQCHIKLKVTKKFEERQEIINKLDKLSSFLAKPTIRFADNINLTILALDIFSIFDLYSGEPTYYEIIKFFKSYQTLEVEQALGILLRENYIRRQEKKFIYANAEIKNLISKFNPDQNKTATEILRQTFLDASKKALSPANNCQYFRYQLFNCKHDDLKNISRTLRSDIKQTFANLESESADTISRICLSMQPIARTNRESM